MAGVLEGIRIVELAGLGPAPFASMMLADHGADVIRIHALKPRRGIPAVDSRQDLLARGRQSIAADLKNPDACALVLDLIGEADGLIEGFRPGVAERLGLGPDTCLERNPKLAYGRMTGWGQTGPLARTAGHDINYIALSGALSAIGPADRPVPPLNLVGDFGGGGMMLAFGMLAAILHARSTGKGQVIDAAMTDGSAVLSTMIHGLSAAKAWSGHREANLLDGGAYFYGTYRCSDSGFVAVGAIEPQFHAQFIKGLGLDPEAFDQHDQSGWPDAREAIAAAIAAKPRAHWETVFAGTDACVTPVLGLDEAPRHPHNVGRAAFYESDGIVQPSPAPRFSQTPASMPAAPALPSPDAPNLLKAWGIAPDRTAALMTTGALGVWG